MTFRPPAFVLIVFTLIVFVVACGSHNSTPAAIVVTFTLGFTPPTSMNTQSPGNTAGIAATVTNGPLNAVVNWSCTPTSQCGDFAPPSTASTIPTTYTAPTSVPADGTVNVTATSVTDPTKSISATITIH